MGTVKHIESPFAEFEFELRNFSKISFSCDKTASDEFESVFQTKSLWSPFICCRTFGLSYIMNLGTKILVLAKSCSASKIMFSEFIF